MNEPGNNKQPWARGVEDSSFKDKRLLVLFLSGLLFIGADVWPFHFSPDTISLFLTQSDQAGEGQIKLIAIAPAQKQAQQKREGGDLANDGEIAPLFSSIGASFAVPVELDLFLTRPLRLNKANEPTIAMLPGIGPHLAKAIVTTRNRQGAFTTPQDLLRVPGVGPARMQQLQPLVSFE